MMEMFINSLKDIKTKYFSISQFGKNLTNVLIEG